MADCWNFAKSRQLLELIASQSPGTCGVVTLPHSRGLIQVLAF